MTRKEFSTAEAKARFSSLLAAAEHGSEVVITRRGKPVVQLRALQSAKTAIDFRFADALRARQTVSRRSSAAWLREIRDQAR